MLFFNKKPKTQPVQQNTVNGVVITTAPDRVTYDFIPAPIDTTGYKFVAPTDAQISYAQNLGIILKQGMTKDDVSNCISRLTEGDGQIIPGASVELLRFAQSFGAQVSPYGTEAHAVYMILNLFKKDQVKKTALYLYGVSCALTGRRFEFGTPDSVFQFCQLAEQFNADKKALDSLNGREFMEYYVPVKTTTCFKKAKELLGL